jgi:hypothetical protein
MTTMAGPAMAYIESDVPEGMRLASWKATVAPRRRSRRVAAVRIRPLSALDAQPAR